MAERRISSKPEEPSSPASGLRRYDDALPIALLQAREAVMNRFRPHLARRNLTEQQWRVIRILAEAGELDATELAQRCCILKPSLSRISKALSGRGLIRRSRAGDDGRRVDMALTRKGRALFEEMAPESVAIYGEIERRFGAARIDELLATLHRLRHALND